MHFESADTFELLRRKVRAEEYEMSLHKSSAVSKDNKPEIKPVKETIVVSTDKQTTSTPIQVQSAQQDPNTKLLTDLAKRMEELEKAIKNINRSRPFYRGGAGRGRGATPATANVPEKKETLNK